MTTPIADEKLPELEALLAKATPGPWDVWREQCPDLKQAMAELAYQVLHSDPYAGELFLLNAGGKCPGTTGCGPTSEANAALIVFLRNHGDSLLARIRSDQQERAKAVEWAAEQHACADDYAARLTVAENRVSKLREGLRLARRDLQMIDALLNIGDRQ